MRYYAVAGDVHGEFGLLKEALDAKCSSYGLTARSLDGIFLVGDVEAIRSEDEMNQVHGPSKYRKMGDFQKVTDGEISFEAPVYFIGGNHEPWEALDKDGGLTRHGGDWGGGFTYLGRSGVLELNGMRVGFLSGISSPEMRENGPRANVEDRTRDSKRNRTYWQSKEVQEVLSKGLKKHLDLLLTHEWPSGLGVGKDGKAAGSWQVRELVDKTQVQLSVHGHMHFSGAAKWGSTEVRGLPHISQGEDAIEIFTFTKKTVKLLS